MKPGNQKAIWRMPLRFFKNIKGGRTCNRTLDNSLNLQLSQPAFSQPILLINMYACNFNTDSFLTATLFIEHLIQNEDNIFNLIDICKNDSTLTLDLDLILEAVNTEKQLEDKLGYKDTNVLSLHIILTTTIAAAIRHGIINTIRDSPELLVVPDYIPSHFAGQGIIQYFKEHNTNIHSYRKKAPVTKKPIRYHPYLCTNIHRCSKCKRLGHVRRDCCNYQCTKCQLWGPGHTTPNCPMKKERDNQQWKKEWEKALVKWEIANQRIDEEKYPPVIPAELCRALVDFRGRMAILNW